MKGYKLIIFGNTIFDSKGSVRKVRFELQQYDISFKRCRYCNVNEVKEKYFISQEFINSSKYLYVDLIQLTYPSSPRGAHSILVNEDDYYNSGMNSGLPNTYKGWGSSPSNLYIPIEYKVFAIDELDEIKIIAVREEVETKNLKNYIGSITAGQAGNWKFYINVDFERKNIQSEMFGHRSCIKKRKFSELDEYDIYEGINKKYFNRIINPNKNSTFKEIYVSEDFSEVFYEYEIYECKKENDEISFINKDNELIKIKIETEEKSKVEEIEE